MVLKVSIAHENISEKDAIGHDILGMAKLLRELGVEVTLFGQNFSEGVCEQYSTCCSMESLIENKSSILIYHHSVYWEEGSKLLENFKGEVIFKFHNVTPFHYFSGYSELYEDFCKKGNSQTKELLLKFQDSLWISDSKFNQNQLKEINSNAKKLAVCPPLHLFDISFPETKRNLNHLIFVGRLVPNKGHRTLLRVFSYYREFFNANAKLEIIGNSDLNLESYRSEVLELSKILNIESCIKLSSDLSQPELFEKYKEVGLFLCFSEHEGFCVPIIEAQSMGLPVLSARAGAIEETVGRKQLIDTYPKKDSEYFYYAKLIDEIVSNEKLRKFVINEGYKNFTTHFDRNVIADLFSELLFPMLKKNSSL
tara:strand:- start:11830 stop:12930 length:1101 start_codon:yes stop_codon:yes gene_type:complete